LKILFRFRKQDSVVEKMAKMADCGIGYGRIEAVTQSDSSNSGIGQVSSRRGGARLDASGASKAGNKTNTDRVKSGQFVGPRKSTLGFVKHERPFLNRRQKKNNPQQKRLKKAQQRRWHQRTRSAEPPYLARIKVA
jgi:hypothetical protein